MHIYCFRREAAVKVAAPVFHFAVPAVQYNQT